MLKYDLYAQVQCVVLKVESGKKLDVCWAHPAEEGGCGEWGETTCSGSNDCARQNTNPNGHSLAVRGSNPGGGRDFPHLSRPGRRPTQPPIQWGARPFPGVKLSGRGDDHPLHLAPRLMKE